ncbi:hypothetical protein Q4506_06185 [Colwellia sp. 4_MG-2023]|uniref:BACON domain-containing protein n=1 Tax=unclassified Colwellia TaxID=196834 RepID=UPI001C08443E|nr:MULTISPECIES: hypothetical protein [unclassified Colwellia]MBU2925477.1 hypothetical protein [Colwellia sp. C2M11]MDO6506435.1 hypothetical protein [Colwellia sp. 5_MG-2023]MDO6555259.1 hypothetical protein [Colwellia sp. 4_MG-2023]MDO6651555.1 hypothetical protein [Colwellia sp. 3_MG-2023]MDO6665047.1 hypothetical protein [Colwellia sp. 2_MG-2023]
MKEPMRQLYKVILLTTVIMLQACGSSEDKTVFSISADVSEVSFSNEFLQESTESIAINVSFVGDGVLVGFSPEAISAPWLEYRTENVTENSATVFIDVINAQFLLTDTYNTTLRLATSNEDSSKFAFHDIDISLLIWNLAVDTEKVSYSGTFGDETIPAQSISILTEEKEWTASTDVDWLSLDITSGIGETEIVVTPDISEFTEPGLQQGNIILTDIDSGEIKLVPVEVALDNVYLLADQTAVALSATNSISTLEKTVSVSNNADLDISWTATTDANWLTLTKDNNEQLTITADASLASANNNSSAQVTISADSGIAAISETITINFYNSSQDVSNNVITPLAINSSEIVTSPLKPVFYLGVGNELLTYHQYTGELESSVEISPEGTILEQLIIHPNGDYLLVKATEIVTQEDETSTEVVHRYSVSLDDYSITEIIDTDIISEPIAIVRLSGRYFVITQAFEFADENLNVLFWDAPNAFLVSKVAVASQANTLFALDNSTASFKRYIPQVNDFGDDKVSVSLTHEYHPELLADDQVIFDFMVTSDEANIYALSQSSEWISFDGDNFVDNGLLEASESVVTLSLVKNSNDQPNYYRFNSANELGFYLDVYDNHQTISSTTYTQGSQPANLRLSGDDQRLIIYVDSSSDGELDSQIELVTIP